MKSVNLPPDAASFMWANRSNGYTAETAIADLIDNSITASASNVAITFSSLGNGYVAILDDGKGLQKDALKQAMKYGSCHPNEVRESYDLGRFGLGLKAASLSQCRKLTVVSKKEAQYSAFCWDLDYIFSHSEQGWVLIELEESEYAKLPQYASLTKLTEGTLVVWQNLDRICLDLEDLEQGLQIKIRDVEKHLALTFHRYLQGEHGLKKLVISCNGNIIEPIDPFFKVRSEEGFSEIIPLKVGKKGYEHVEYVEVTPYTLPFLDTLTQQEIDALGGKDGLIKNQGFYVYRNKRLIVAASWFRLARKTDLTKLCRVQVDIPNSMDEEWTLDIKKSVAIPPAIIVQNLSRIIQKILQRGKRKYTFRAKKEISKKVKLWEFGETRNGIIYTVNRNYPLIKDVINQLSGDGLRKLELMLKLIEQNLPLNSFHTDFYNDKKFAYEDSSFAKNNVIQQLKEILCDASSDEDRRKMFEELMQISPFDMYVEEITYEDVR